MSLALATSTICVAIGIHVACTAPTPPAPKNRRLMRDFTSVSHITILILKYGCWLHAIIEFFTGIEPGITSRRAAGSTLAEGAVRRTVALFLQNDRINFHPALSPTRVIAGVGVIMGGIGRYLCYRELGRQYTFQVSVLQNHSLVTTGPYGVVRHPGYTSGCLVLLGLLVWHAAPGSWLRESGMYNAPLAWIIMLPALYAIGFLLIICARRPNAEDELLKKEFGEKWKEWAKVVRYRLIPGVY